MAGKSRTELATVAAEQLVKDLKIDRLPIDPIAIAEGLGILVQPKPTSGGVSGMLIRLGNEFAIAYASHIDNDGFKRFCVGHELGHYHLPGHVDAVLAHGDIHESRAGSFSDDPYEREADHFAAGLLMPDPLFSRELRRLGDGLEAVEAVAGLCGVSLTAAAIRYIEKASVPVAMVVSAGPHVEYCFMSKALQDFDGLSWLRKDQVLPAGSATDRFNDDADNVRLARRADDQTDLRDWFGGTRNIPATEEVIGLGGYGKTLTIMSSEIFADDEDEEEDVEERWTPGFHR
jgi:Zn-dependent peptidase ImmA (M78 family)